ncbi:hypothetical protein [Methylibium sp.]|uniref:hypothetical protein n=1 Tax=Methylibium sp. TaxID=2067992 RepID=UPI003D1114BC
MTVADLIRELQAMPQGVQVRLLLDTVHVPGFEGFHELYHVPLEQATEVDEVRHMGPWVLLRAR